MSIVRNKLQTSVHYCDATKKGVVQHYSDDYNLAQQDGLTKMGQERIPTKDGEGNPFSTEYGYCVYKDS